MAGKKNCLALSFMLVMVTFSPILNASAFSPPETTVSISTTYSGSLTNGGTVYTSPNPQFTLSVTQGNNSSLLSTQYKFGSNGTVTNYNGSFTYWANYSESFTLFYRSNTTTGLENWKQLNVNIDASLPVIEIGTATSPAKFSKLNSTNYLISPSVPLQISCSDSTSSVQTFAATISNTNITGSSGALTLTYQQLSSITNTTTAQVLLTCTDFVGLQKSENITIEMDLEAPNLSVSELGQRYNSCVELSWQLFATSQDNQTNSSIEYRHQSTWQQFNSPMSFEAGFNSTIQLRAIDDMGTISSIQNISVFVDDSGPSIAANLSSSFLNFQSNDPCGVATTSIQWESYSGSMTPWALTNSSTIYIPSILDGELIRAKINSTDELGNANTLTTPWSHSNQSMPRSHLQLLSQTRGGYSVEQFRVIITPLGHQTNTSWNLLRNNVSVLNSTAVNSQSIVYNFTHGDKIDLALNASGSLGVNTLQNYSWIADGQNNMLTPISVTGSYQNTSQLVLGSTGRLSHGLPTDDLIGVGGSFVECTFNGTGWSQSMGGPYIAQPIQQNSDNFVFGCRSVDFFGNRGPTVWNNGSLDITGPDVTIQPFDGTTIGLTTPIGMLAYDPAGVTGFSFSFTWQNTTSQQFSNFSQIGSNQTFQLSQIFPGVRDGTLSLNLTSTDSLGNIRFVDEFGWIVNTSNPYVSLEIFNGSGQFISLNSTELRLIPPTSWGASLTMNYTLESASSILLNGSATSSVVLHPQFTFDGYVWLNVSTNDSLGRSSTQSWRLYVDDSVNTQPMFRIINQNITSGGALIIGPYSMVQVVNAIDDVAGVGQARALCSLDSSTFFAVQNNGIVPIPTTGSPITQHALFCKNIDGLGNIGSGTWLNFTVDKEKPTHSVSPVTAYIAPNQIFSLSAFDNQSLVHSVLYLEWSNSSTTLNRSTSFSTSNYNLTIEGIFGQLDDGLISGTLRSTDAVGNTIITSQFTWNLTTTQPIPSLGVSGNIVGNKIGTGNVSFTVSALVGGEGIFTGNYTVIHSNGTVFSQSNFNSETLILLSNLSSGQIQINISVTDDFQRTQFLNWFYSIDDSLTVLPQININGLNISQQSSLWIGPSTTLSVTNLRDDLGGVGHLRTECRWDFGSWFTYTPGTNISISAQENIISNETLSCRNIDRLENIGPTTSLNLTIDFVKPDVVFSPTGLSIVAPTTQLNVNASDDSGIAFSSINLNWSDGQRAWSTSNLFYGDSWNTTLHNLASNISDGALSVQITVSDRVGNQRILTGIGWNVNTTQPLTDVDLNGNHVGSFIGTGNISFTLTPSGVDSSVQYNLESNPNWSYFNGTTNTSSSIHVNNLTEGRIWLNTTTTDLFDRIQSQSFVYDVDQSIGTMPNIALVGTNQIRNNATFLGADGGYQLLSNYDDGWGIGLHQVSCSWNGGEWFGTSISNLLAPPSLSNAVTGYSLRCRNVDLLGNIGQIGWWNGSIDLEKPELSFSTLVGMPLSSNSQINMSCSDSAGCELVSLTAIYSEGVQQTNFQNSLSSNETSFVLSQLLNVTSQGTVQFSIQAKDRLNNTKIITTPSYLYLHNTPTVAIDILSEFSGSYVSENLTITLSPSSGWNSGLTLNMTLQYAQNGTMIRESIINSSSSSQIFSSLAEGDVWLNSSLCNTIGNCSNSASLLTVDSSAPEAPNLLLSDGVTLTNGSFVAGSAALFNITNGIEWGAGIHSTNCSTTNLWRSTSVSGSLYSIGVLAMSNQWVEISCTSTDKVGNTGSSSSFIVYRDDLRPSINSSHLPNDLVITPGIYFNTTCIDLFSTSFRATFVSGGQIIAQVNSSASYSILAEDLLGVTSYPSVQYNLTCTDASGNKNTSTKNFEWLPYLEPSQLQVSSISKGSENYLSNSTIISTTNSRSDIIQHVRLISTTNNGSWFSISSSIEVGELNFSVVDQTAIRIQIRVTRLGCGLSNLTTSEWIIMDNSGPELTLPSFSWYGNSTNIPILSNDSGVGFERLEWVFDNLSNFSSRSLNDVRLPNGFEDNVWINITSYDKLGNRGPFYHMNLYRDHSLPAVIVNESHPGYIGLNTSYMINLNTSTGLKTSQIYLETANNNTFYLSNNTSTFMFSSSNLPGWILSSNELNLIIRVTENSQLTAIEEWALIVDLTQPTATINYSTSNFISGLNTSNQSVLAIDVPSDTMELCYKQGPNTTSMTSECISLSSPEIQITRPAGNYVLYVEAVDNAGNIGRYWYNVVHHTVGPSITLTIPDIVRPTQGYTVISNSGFNPDFELMLGNQSMSHTNGNFIIPHTLGNKTLLINASNDLGLFETLNVSLVVDGSAPTISIEGWRYNSTMIGTNTVLWINSSDSQSNINEINITASSGTQSCQESIYPQSSIYANNGTLPFILGDYSCDVLSAAGVQLEIEITVEDWVGNRIQRNYSIEYHGATQSPYFVNDRVYINSEFNRIGPKSSIQCLDSVGSIVPSLNLSWTGTGGLIQSSTLQSPLSSGVLTCTQTDDFGNIAQTSLNLTYDLTDPTINITWPSSAHQQYVMSSGQPFSIGSSDSEAPITVLRYCIASAPCTPSINSTGNTQFVTSSGLQYLVVFTENTVGLNNSQTISFILDNQLPSLNMSTGENSIINGTSIYTGIINSSIIITAGDVDCFHSGLVRYNSGSMSLDNWTQTKVTIPQSSTYLDITIQDCVGHLTVQNYSVDRITGIVPQSFTVIGNYSAKSFLSGSVLSLRDSTSMSITILHNVEVNLLCDSLVVSITCEETNLWNEFIINVSSQSNGFFDITFSDALGNYLNQSYRVEQDSTSPVCTLHEYAYFNGTDLVLPSTTASKHLCVDNKNIITEAYWEHQNTSQPWTLQGGVWIAPVPLYSSVDLVVVDRLGNKRVTSVSIIFDSEAPVLSMTNTSFISFDELMAKRQASFIVECQDMIGLDCFIHVKQTNMLGEVMWEENFTQEGHVVLQLETQMQQMRIWIETYDLVGHERSLVYLITLDDEKPILDISWKNSNTGVLLNGAFIPSNGVFEINGLMSSGVNQSMSTLEIKCVDSEQVIHTDILRSSMDLDTINLGGCLKISLDIKARDHAGNLQSIITSLQVDHLIPRGVVGYEPGCSWYQNNAADLTPDCEVYIEVIDDSNALLRGQYSISIYSEDGQLLNTSSVSTNSTILLPPYVGKSVNILLAGADRVGNAVQWETVTLHVRRNIEPHWIGIQCLESNPCPFGTSITATPIESEIGLGVQSHHAPIVDATLIFGTGGDEKTFDSAMISSSNLPDGVWPTRISLRDAAGRTIELLNSMNFTFDTKPPELIIGSATVGYYEDNQTILGCNTCVFSYKFVDLTDLILSSNVQGVSIVESLDGFTVIELRGISQQEINISATDIFQRTTWLNLSIIPLETTNLQTNEYFTDGQVNTFCKEEAPSEKQREIVCIWRRTSLGSVRIPLSFDIELDTSYDRTSELSFTIDGIDKQSTALEDGLFVQYIESYNANIFVEVVDNYSNVKPLNITILEHDAPWGSIEFLGNDVKEIDEETEILLQLTPDQRHGEFHLLDSKNQSGLSFDCEIEYVFISLERQKAVRINSDACSIKQLFEKGNKDLELTLLLNHDGVRDSGELFEHRHDLVNLESISILLEYSDQLGLEEKLNRNDLRIGEENIERAFDITPIYSGVCPLDFGGETASSDGFLQSDVTMPLHQCESEISDMDGIHSTIWNMTFFNTQGNEVYSIEIQCSGTSFPVDWSFESAFNSGQCEDPRVPLPSGTFDVRIRPYIRDYTMYNEDGLVNTEALPILGNQSQCSEANTPCFIEITVASVTVYPSFNPAVEVKNAQEFIESWSNDLGIGYILLNLGVLSSIVFYIRRSRLKSSE